MTPLSHQQKRLWYIDQLHPQTPAPNIAFGLDLKGPIDGHKLSTAIQLLIANSAVLQSDIDSSGSEPVLRQQSITIDSLTVKNLQKATKSEQQSHYEHFANQRISLQKAPLFRFELVQLATQHHQLLCLFHSAIFDHQAISLFCAALFNHYDGTEFEKTDHHSPTQQPPSTQQNLDYWQQQLAGTLPVLEFPSDDTRPALQSFRADVIEKNIDSQTTAALTNLAQKRKLSTETLLLAAFTSLIARYSRQNDLIVGLQSQQEPFNAVGPINQTLPVRFKINADQPFHQFSHYVAQQTEGFVAHQSLPFETLVQLLHDKRDLSLHPLYQCSFSYQKASQPKRADTELSIEALHHYYPKALLTDLALTVEPRQGELRCVLQYSTDLFPATLMTQWLNHFTQLVEYIIQHSETPLYALKFMLEEEQRQQRIEWNNTEQSLPDITNFTALISTQAQQTPDKDAVVFGDNRISYQQLETKSNQLARYLISQGAGPNKIIGLSLDRSIELLIALLGILKSGAAYLPLDPDYPAERILYILENAQVELLVTNQYTQQRLPSVETQTILLDQIADALTELDEGRPENNASDRDSAYVIYTSGSTGNPKGVDVSHRNVMNFLLSMRQQPGLNEKDRLLAVTTISFDIAVLELYLPLITGATVIMASRQEAVDGHALLALIDQHKITTLQATPASWRLLIQAGWTNKHALKALCGGEALSKELGQALLTRASSVWNMYGPTETTVWSSCDQLSLEQTDISIGRPIHNTQCYVLDEYQQIVPVGVNGELYIGGEGVTKGYLHNVKLSAERFVADPFTSNVGAQLYRTGDLVRYQADSRIKYLHRIDNQIKLRGFRIELGEIESSLLQHPNIQEAVVNIQTNNDDSQLVAYCVYKPSHSATVSELRSFLQTRLPDYMVPSLYVDMPQLPLTPSGKIDKKALPEPFTQSQALHYVAPRTESETYLAALWQRILNQPKISIQANFFDQGGHSLLSMSVIAQIKKEHDIDVPARAMIMDTLEQIAAHYFTSDTTTTITAPTQASASSNAFFFGSSAQALYGVYHPGTQIKPKKAVLLCYPYGHEYMRIHWAFRRLTDQLNQAGYPVLRFDYSGTGDSAGDPKKVSIAQWQQDILTAAFELKTLSGAATLSVIGHRLGALLAASVAELCTEELILWEPLSSGADYLKVMATMNQAVIQRLNKFRRHRLRTTPEDYVGMRFPLAFQDELSQLSLTQRIPQTQHVHIVHSNENQSINLARDYFEKNNITTHHIHTPAKVQWNQLTSFAEAVHSTDDIKAIMSVFSKNSL